MLAREGLSVSEAVRGLYEELVREQKVPDWLIGEGAEEAGRRMIEEIKHIVEPIAGKYEAKKVSLFGSRALKGAVDIVTTQGVSRRFLEKIQKDAVVLYEAG